MKELVGKYEYEGRRRKWKICANVESTGSFGLGGLRMWEKEDPQKVRVKKGNICSVMVKVDLY